jgi:hypothetical protein
VVSGIWPQSAARSGRKGPGDIVGSGGGWLPPAGRYPAVHKWYGEKETSSGIRTLEKCGRQKEFTTAGIRMTCCAEVARRKGRSHEGPLVEQGRQKDQTRVKFTNGTSKRMDVWEETSGESRRQH